MVGLVLRGGSGRSLGQVLRRGAEKGIQDSRGKDRLLPRPCTSGSRRTRRRDGARGSRLDGLEKDARRRTGGDPPRIQPGVLPANGHCLLRLVLRGRVSIRQKRRALRSLTVSQPRDTRETLSPRPLMRLLGDFGNSRILDAAIEFDFFTLLHRGFDTYEEVAREAGTVPRATRIVLDGLLALALVEKRKGKYFLTPISETYLVRGKPSYMGDFRYVALSLWDGMAHLKETLKTGKPLSRLDTSGELQVWEKLVLGIIQIAEPVAKALCDLLEIGVRRKGPRVLDIAGGSSIFGMTILTR